VVNLDCGGRLSGGVGTGEDVVYWGSVRSSDVVEGMIMVGGGQECERDGGVGESKGWGKGGEGRVGGVGGEGRL